MLIFTNSYFFTTMFLFSLNLIENSLIFLYLFFICIVCLVLRLWCCIFYFCCACAIVLVFVYIFTAKRSEKGEWNTQIKMVVVSGKLLRRAQGWKYKLTIINHSLQPFSTLFTLDVLFLSFCDRQNLWNPAIQYIPIKLNNNTTIFIW